MSVLVTGGAGYIGSHMVRELLRRGEPVVVVDNLATGHRDAVPKQVPFLHADIRARSELTAFLRRHHVNAILHFAARSLVGESMVNPRRYYRDNLTATVELLELALDENIGHFVLSSTAAVYGDPRQVPMDESHPTVPVNPYGSSKLALEQVLADYHRAYGLRFAALRYFNACGAEPEFGLGERHEPETHLLPLVMGAALGTRPPVTIFGTDYPTPDGTCIRDYVHVRDLAEAHMDALAYLRQGGASGAFNLGTGVGHSVLAVIAAVEDVTGRPVPKTVGPRRPGDPPALVASPEKARSAFGWVAQRADLRTMVADAYAFHRTQAS